MIDGIKTFGGYVKEGATLVWKNSEFNENCHVGADKRGHYDDILKVFMVAFVLGIILAATGSAKDPNTEWGQTMDPKSVTGCALMSAASLVLSVAYLAFRGWRHQKDTQSSLGNIEVN